MFFSVDFKKVLLCRRKGENDYDGMYSFIGGKMEIMDKDIISAMQREKNEEVGKDFKIEVCSDFSNNLVYKKKSGDYMILPHYLAKYISGEISLNEEYSEYKWVDIKDLDSFEPKIKNIFETVKILLKLRNTTKDMIFVVI